MASPLSSISEPPPDRARSMDYYWTERSSRRLTFSDSNLENVRMDTARSFLKQPSAWKSKYCVWFAGSLFWRVTSTQLRWGTQYKQPLHHDTYNPNHTKITKKLWWKCGWSESGPFPLIGSLLWPYSNRLDIPPFWFKRGVWDGYMNLGGITMKPHRHWIVRERPNRSGITHNTLS